MANLNLSDTNDRLRDAITQAPLSAQQLHATLEQTRSSVQAALSLSNHEWHDLEMFFQLREQLRSRDDAPYDYSDKA